jgi:hypothetical protein
MLFICWGQRESNNLLWWYYGIESLAGTREPFSYEWHYQDIFEKGSRVW